ncbi:MAG: bifunctional phosphopantothenoylcysteine decarboxylase/phosphopantothenate--cysteine ligase CoaBC, partial [Actinobacteria bacterium]|nr:bifunctional phosphopantothenoylcysteine decarboxylase/phosphopantothenate--cysteine ligase CoaBC [Actinomycetota bacterium]
VHVVEPESGRLAGGDLGHGRLAAPERIVAAVEACLGPADLAGLSVVVTAGGTREPIDPVRFIGNRSSGKQGHALAAAAQRRGASVTLVTTVPQSAPPGTTVVAVDTAAEMDAAVAEVAPTADVVVMAAAVADFRPVAVAGQKLKKAAGVPEVRLEPTVDILARLGAAKTAGQTLVGFAAETTDVEANAQAKLVAKGADLLVANDVSAPQVGFEHDTNAVVIHRIHGSPIEVPLAGKDVVADAVLDAVLAHRLQSAGSEKP